MTLSIITINYNNLSGLRKTVESVFAQTNRDFEYIIIDGASTDGSKEYLDTIKAKDASGNLQTYKFTNLQVVSEPDTGIYNAMNKGIRVSHGDYLLMLNSGDYLVDSNVIAHILPELDGTDIIQGNTIVERNGKLFIHRGYGHSDLSFIEIQHGDFPHQATFTQRSVFERYGYFDESYKLIADTIFFLKALGYGDATFKYVDLHIAYFAPGGVSDTQKGLQDMERKRMETELLSPRLRHLCQVEEYKIVLWEKLHKSKFLWWGTMLLVHIYDVFHPHQKRALIADKWELYSNGMCKRAESLDIQ